MLPAKPIRGFFSLGEWMNDTMIAGQLDLLAMAAEDARLATESAVGVPSLYSLRCSRPRDYLAAFDEWKDTYGQFGSIYYSHAWRPAMCGPGHDDTTECAPAILEADTSCDHDHRDHCSCVGARDILWRSVCRHCGHHTPIVDDEDHAVVHGLDHAYPGWREQVVVSSPPPQDGSRASEKAYQRWVGEVADLYGAHSEGWPVITDRRNPHRLRSVPRRSPWNGYDVAVAILDRYPPAH